MRPAASRLAPSVCDTSEVYESEVFYSKSCCILAVQRFRRLTYTWCALLLLTSLLSCIEFIYMQPPYLSQQVKLSSPGPISIGNRPNRSFWFSVASTEPSSIAGGATYPLNVKVPIGQRVRVIFANGEFCFPFLQWYCLINSQANLNVGKCVVALFEACLNERAPLWDLR